MFQSVWCELVKDYITSRKYMCEMVKDCITSRKFKTPPVFIIFDKDHEMARTRNLLKTD